MKDTNKAVEVYEPGKLRVVKRPIAESGAGQVWIRVEACGICHTEGYAELMIAEARRRELR
jgi:D-arabinose 1-dehydrogenase-like Zn-dependent alcohol dehydrogenase